MVSGRWVVRLAPIGVGLIAVALGAWRLMPGVGLWDTAEFQTIPPILGTAHPTGYPTYVILGWLASTALGPLGEAAFRMNLLSAILVGVAAAITVDLVRMLTGWTILGVVTGLGLATTPVVWAIATHADPHALHLVFVAGLLWLLVRWVKARRENRAHADRWLVAVAAVTGLSVGNHSLTLFLVPPMALYALAVEPRILRHYRLVAACILAVAISTILVYLELPLRGGAVPFLRADLVYGRPDTWGGFAYIVTGEQFRGGLIDPFGDLPGKLAALVGLAIRQFGPLTPLAVAGFILSVGRFPAYALLTGTTMFITCFFNASYDNADIGRYYLGPALIAWTWIAILAGSIVERAFEAPVAEAPDRAVPVYGPRPGDEPGHEGPAGPPPARRGPSRPDGLQLAGVALTSFLLLAPTVMAFPARAAAVDRTSDRGAQVWLDAVLAEVEPQSIIVSWWSYSTPLWYAQQIQRKRPDIFVADDRTRLDLNLGEVTDVIDANLGKRPVYVVRIVRQEFEQLQARYNLSPLASPFAQNVLRVTPRTGADARP